MNKFEVYQHLLERGMLPTYYNVSVDDDVAVFPLHDFSGKQVGYQNYRPFAERNSKNVKEARYFTYLPRGVNGYFGLGTLSWPGLVYLVEGVFKAATLHRLGKPSLALMGSETKRYKSQLLLMRRPFLAIGDNDAAGRKFAQSLGGITSPVDLDEMTDAAIMELISENSKTR